MDESTRIPSLGRYFESPADSDTRHFATSVSTSQYRITILCSCGEVFSHLMEHIDIASSNAKAHMQEKNL